jgi:hypothetical protein
MMALLDDPAVLNEPNLYGPPGRYGQYDPRPWLEVWLRPSAAYWRREPERSRRVIRLVLANWLTQFDKPLHDRAPLAPTKMPLYVTTSKDPPASRALSPEVLASWHDSTLFARAFLGDKPHIFDSSARGQGDQAAMVLTVAEQLYLREHGRPSQSPEDLVGPDLPRLPDPPLPPESR